ncbi:MAG: response regulator [Vampirovibrionales bacterium]|nr:response regulator [Vampirovibrionales bacterium]
MTHRILIIEDNPSTCKLAKDILEFQGHQILVADNAGLGIDIARHEKPDLIIMDMLLPIKNGYEATGELKEDGETAHIPVVAFSAMVSDADKQKAKACGCDGFIEKPVDFANFSKQIKAFLS